MAKAKKEPRIHDRLLESLAGVDRPGAFCTWGDRVLTLPGLEVRGLGPIGLPLTKTQARELIKLCRQAPFGELLSKWGRAGGPQKLADAALDDAEPSQEDFEGYTGNEGMTLDRWYHRAAVVIWPRSRHFQVLSGAGTEASIGGLEAMVKRLKRVKKAEREGLRRECLSFAAAIIDSRNAAGARIRWCVRKPRHPMTRPARSTIAT